MSDIINKAGMCGKSVKYVTTQPFLFCFSLVKSEPTWLRPEKFQFEARKQKKKEEEEVVEKEEVKGESRRRSRRLKEKRSEEDEEETIKTVSERGR